VIKKKKILKKESRFEASLGKKVTKTPSQSWWKGPVIPATWEA
jgi:hypothetical protein